MNNEQCTKYIFVYEKYHVEEREETWVAEAILDRMLGKYGWKCGICEKELTGNERAKYEVFSRKSVS